MTVESILISLFILDVVLIYSYNPNGAVNRFLSLLLIPITLTNLEMLFLYSVKDKIPVETGLNMALFGLVVKPPDDCEDQSADFREQPAVVPEVGTQNSRQSKDELPVG
ncbi:MAG: hypothetical protein HWN51_00970 [Desulfobacterales bacterium]|nr:hypothetical protein [Desulfobacterales bacterium]